MPVSPGGTKYDDGELDALFQAVGFVVVQWGQAEQTLDIIVAMLYQKLGGKKHAKKLPFMLKEKLKFVGKCLSKISDLKKYESEGKSLVTDFEELSVTRHKLIHGAISSLSLEDGAFRFAKLDIRNDFHEIQEFRFESEEFPVLAKKLIDLGSAATGFAEKLCR